MKLTVHRAGCRGHADHGWLNTWHSFSFAGYYNPDRMHFGALRVLNDDTVQAGMGFGTHPHDNMEIITIVLEGELEHRDSMGTGSVIRPGEVQVMSAGTGIQHSEFNHSAENEVSLLQIWVFPDQKNVEPRYDQAKFQDDEMNGKWRTVVSPDGNENSLMIHQQAWFSMGEFEPESTVSYQLKKAGNFVYLFLISGEIQIESETLNQRDALGLEEIDTDVKLKIIKKSKILVMEIPE
ncbi:MAG TPA: pirin family protein [Prolixibacteraceae bacterium]|nr:pirin family protein [Prolixibacteraceae bacterium]